MNDRTELRRFLTSRRARLHPKDVGLHDHGGVRRVPGLRREELAQLARVTIAHYTRLEQGNSHSVSTEILNAVGTALRLTPDEQTYLHHIARRPRLCTTDNPTPQVLPGQRHLLASLVMTPALVIGRHTQIIGWNDLAVAVFGDFPSLADDDRTLSHLWFAEPYLRELLGTGWADAAREHVAHLRVLVGRFRQDAGLAAHIDRMRESSKDFAEMWAEHAVARFRSRAYVMRHPVVGELTLRGERIALPEEPACCALDVYAAEPGSSSAKSLRRLAEPLNHGAER